MGWTRKPARWSTSALHQPREQQMPPRSTEANFMRRLTRLFLDNRIGREDLPQPNSPEHRVGRLSVCVAGVLPGNDSEGRARVSVLAWGFANPACNLTTVRSRCRRLSREVLSSGPAIPIVPWSQQ